MNTYKRHPFRPRFSAAIFGTIFDLVQASVRSRLWVLKTLVRPFRKIPKILRADILQDVGKSMGGGGG
jgi:hypothetical protein